MKSKLLMVVALIATLAFTSCKPKLSEETKKSINDFKTDWTKMSGDLSAWGETLNGDVTKLDDQHKKMGEECGDTAKLKKEAKAKMKESMAACAVARKSLDDMNKAYADFKKGIDTTTTAFTDWAAKVDKGEVDEAAAKTAMDGYTKQLADAKTNMDTWNKSLTDIMAGEAKNHEDCMAVCMPGDKKKDGDKKKGDMKGGGKKM